MDRRSFLSTSISLPSALVAQTRTASRADASLAGARQWFGNNLFNLAVDYWGTDFVPYIEYGGGYSKEQYVRVLRDLKPGFVMIYAKGESGRTSFKSATGSEHPKLTQDVLSLFNDIATAANTKLFLYWSGLEDLIAANRHPNWRMLDREQKPIRTFTGLEPSLGPYALCPQSSFFQEYVTVQLQEALTKSDAAGMWVDGTWLGPCYCFRCTGRFRAETGSDAELPEGEEWVRYWSRVQYEFRDRWIKYVRKLKPDFLCSFGNITVLHPYLEDRDWTSGDWYSPNNHRLQQSIAMRRYTTLDIPPEAWICDSQMMHALHDVRARTKSLDRILQEGAGVLANGGQWTYWTFPMPSGALIPSRMLKAREAAEFTRQRHDICIGSKPASSTAILTAHHGLQWWNDNISGAAKAFIYLHRSPELIDESNLAADMRYRLIVLPEQAVLSDKALAVLEGFVRGGGSVLSAGTVRRASRLQDFLGISVAEPGKFREGHVLLKDNQSAGVYGPWDRCTLREATQLYPMYLPAGYEELQKLPGNWSTGGHLDEEHPRAADAPAATVRSLGKGKIIHIPTDLFTSYWKVGYLDQLAWLREITNLLDPSPLFTTDAYTFVEVSLREKGDALLVHFVNGNSGRDVSHVNTQDLWADDIPRVGPFTVRIRSARAPGKCTWEPGGTAAKTQWSNGVLTAELASLHIHTCLRVSGWARP